MTPFSAPADAPTDTLAAALNEALPQTQCTRCGYPDCRAYAQAMAEGQAEINLCPPGGAEGIARLARLTGRPTLPLDPARGHEGPRLLAEIHEDACIGCTLCLQACPVDAILGGPKRMHTVMAPQCTGCELCIPVCPVDCIALAPATPGRTGWQAWSAEQARVAAERYAFHQQRLARDEQERQARLAAAAAANSRGSAQAGDTAERASRVTLALERARKRLGT